MKRRDLAWRASGVTLFAASCATAFGTGGYGVLCFVLAIAGLVLAVQGRRVPLMIRVERSRHRELPQSIHDAHRRRRTGVCQARPADHNP